MLQYNELSKTVLVFHLVLTEQDECGDFNISPSSDIEVTLQDARDIAKCKPNALTDIHRMRLIVSVAKAIYDTSRICNADIIAIKFNDKLDFVPMYRMKDIKLINIIKLFNNIFSIL